MMVTTSHTISRLLLVGCLLLGLYGCESDDNPTSPGTVVHTGQTSSGRPFEVVQEKNGESEKTLILRIEGEQDVLIEHIGGIQKTVLESIQVTELPGSPPMPPSLLHITWRDNWYNLHTSMDVHYLVTLQGYTNEILFRQICRFDFWGHYGFSWIKGQHTIDYRNATITLVEHWKECTGGGCGGFGEYQVKEVQFTRRFQLAGYTDLTLLACEELTRSVNGVTGPAPGPGQDLEPLPGNWFVTDLSLDAIAKKCVAQNHEY